MTFIGLLYFILLDMSSLTRAILRVIFISPGHILLRLLVKDIVIIAGPILPKDGINNGSQR